jgi:large subunit ribosomal protein L25
MESALQGSITKNLPERLLRFFARYPPQKYSALVRPQPDPETTPKADSSTLPSPYTANRDAKGFQREDPRAPSASRSLLWSDPNSPNPFLPVKVGERWQGARIGLRRQADLVKMAKKYGVEALLPPGRKSTEFKETRLAEKGLTIKGTGIGQKVKGHRWERTMETRLEDRRKAMMEMPETIRMWKQVSTLCPSFLSSFFGKLVVLIGIFFCNREVMVVAGRSGLRGKLALTVGCGVYNVRSMVWFLVLDLY